MEIFTPGPGMMPPIVLAVAGLIFPTTTRLPPMFPLLAVKLLTVILPDTPTGTPPAVLPSDT